MRLIIETKLECGVKMNKYKNRYDDEYWFESIEPGKYRFVMTGTSMKYCRYGGHELQEHLDMNDLGMFDPSGGPYIAIGTVLPFGTVKRIQALEEGLVLTVE
jgi:hypothetical protein